MPPATNPFVRDTSTPPRAALNVFDQPTLRPTSAPVDSEAVAEDAKRMAVLKQLAARDARISQLEEELAKVKGELENVQVAEALPDEAVTALPTSPPQAAVETINDKPTIAAPPLPLVNEESGGFTPPPFVASTLLGADAPEDAPQEAVPDPVLRDEATVPSPPIVATKRQRSRAGLYAMVAALALAGAVIVAVRFRGTNVGADRGTDATADRGSTDGGDRGPSQPDPGADSKTLESSTPVSAGTVAATDAAATVAGDASQPAVPAVPQSTDAELAALLSFQGYLTVAWPTDAEVFVQGNSVGRTNTRILVRCGSKNVRIKSGDGAWLSAGEHVHVVCMKHTTMTPTAAAR
jgi:hypothetical protein